MFRFIASRTTGVVQTFGRVSRQVEPGLAFYIPFVQTITPVTNAVQYFDAKHVVRTEDNVSPTIHTSIRFQILPEDSTTALLSSHFTDSQIISLVDNSIRQRTSGLTLDQLYATQAELPRDIAKDVSTSMKSIGYTLVDVLFREIKPPAEVLEAMNAIVSSERRKVAARNDGEAHKIKQILEAEGDAARKALQGQGIADMRKAIMDGWNEKIPDMAQKLDLPPSAVIDFLSKMQHLDTLNEIGRQPNTKTLFIPVDHEQAKSSSRSGLLQSLEAKHQ